MTTEFALQSESIKALATAMVKAQANIENAVKDKENPHFKSKYADLASIWDACREALSGNDLAVTQLPTFIGGTPILVTQLTHISGEWLRSYLPLNPVKNDPQGLGSAMTYMRRYGLAAMVGVSPEDDDGNEASKGKRNEKPALQEVPQDNSEARAAQYDYINDINGICDLEELSAYWADNEEFVKALPGDYAAIVIDQHEARKQQLQRGDTAPGPYKFLNVQKMKDYLVRAETELKRCDNQAELDDWKAQNRREAQALDKTRKPELGAMVTAREAQLKLIENNANLRQAG